MRVHPVSPAVPGRRSAIRIALAAASALLAFPGGEAVAVQAYLEDPTAYGDAAAAVPRGIEQAVGFEEPDVSLGQVLTTQYTARGVTFAGSRALRIVDNVEESWPRGLLAAGIDFGAGTSEIRIAFLVDPQHAVSLYVLDVNQLVVEGWAGGVVVESATVAPGAEDLPSGRFLGLVFDGPVEEVVLRSATVSDGFGIDDLVFAEPGTIDNDGDGQTDAEGDCDDLDAAVDGIDGDGDGVTSCDGDCDDADPSVHPGAVEACDGRDDDCDGGVDEGFDVDLDGYTTCAGDCDDTRATVRPGAVETCNARDDDCDAAVDEGFDADGDGSTTCGGDCDDGQASRHPGAPEACDGVDQDCDGEVDEDFDADADGHRTCDGDCDDGRADVNPGAAETCDGADQDCDGEVDEGFDGDGDGFPACDDCDDADAGAFPGAPEICDGLDQDCDGLLDEDFDQDGDGATSCDGDCDDADPGIAPGTYDACGDGVDGDCDGTVDDGRAEQCNGLDDDCDGRTDEDFDADGDGFTTCEGDCDDGSPTTWPGAEELCDGLDQDCDGDVAEEVDGDRDGLAPCEGDCDDSTAGIGPERVEICDGVDQDCDGLVDEGCVDTGALTATDELRGGGCLCAGAGAGASSPAAAGLAAALLGLAVARRRRGRAGFAAAGPWGAAVLALAPSPAAADEAEGPARSLPSERMELPIDGGPFAVGEAAEILEPLEIRAALLLHYSHAPLVSWDAAAEEEREVVAHRVGADLAAGIGLAPFASLGMRLPVTLWQAGTDPDSHESLSGAGIGDLCIAGRFRLLEQGRAPVGLAVGVPLTVPTGNEGGWLGEAGPSFSPQVTVDRRAGRLLVAGTLGARLRAPEQVGTVTLGPELLYRAGLAVDLARGLTVATEVAGAVGGAADNSPLEWLTTLAWAHPRGVEAAAGAGFGVLPGFGTPDVRIYARVAWNVPVGRRPASPGVPVALEEGVVGAEAAAVALVRESRLLLADVVRFDVGRSAIEGSFRPALLAVARWLGAHPEVARLRIEGHADHVGTDAYNLDLSRRRAAAVREFLVREGRVDPLRLEARAFGEGRPAASNGTEEGRAVNRRVEFFASGPAPAPAPTAHAGDEGGG